MSRGRRRTGLAVTAFLAIPTLPSAIGLIYLLQPVRSGAVPRIQDALPLDELSGRARVDILLFLAVWLAAGAVFCLLIDATRITAQAALPVLAATLLLAGYLLAAASIFVVRQVSLTEGLLAAFTTPAVYLATFLAAIPCAVRAVLATRGTVGKAR